MAEYRVYHLVGQRIFGVPAVLHANDDGQALRLAANEMRHDGVEVWCGARRVGILAGPAAEAAS